MDLIPGARVLGVVDHLLTFTAYAAYLGFGRAVAMIPSYLSPDSSKELKDIFITTFIGSSIASAGYRISQYLIHPLLQIPPAIDIDPTIATASFIVGIAWGASRSIKDYA